MSTLESAIQRVNKLKTLAESLLGDDGKNAELIEKKIAAINNRISKLAELRESLKTRVGLMSAQTADIEKIVSQTEGLDELEGKLNTLKAQIKGITDLDLSDLDTTITELEKLISTQSNSSDAPSQPPRQIVTQQPGQVQRAQSVLRGRDPRALRGFTPPRDPRNPISGGYRYDSVAKSKSKSRRRSNIKSIRRTRTRKSVNKK